MGMALRNKAPRSLNTYASHSQSVRHSPATLANGHIEGGETLGAESVLFLRHPVFRADLNFVNDRGETAKNSAYSVTTFFNMIAREVIRDLGEDPDKVLQTQGPRCAQAGKTVATVSVLLVCIFDNKTPAGSVSRRQRPPHHHYRQRIRRREPRLPQ
ncbi:hypothetical protein MRX96_047652 [Rhipicephalus microplus]